MMHWLVTGAGGMLGRDLVAALAAAGQTRVTAADRNSLDITDPAAVRAAIPEHDVVINAAAYTDVDGAELEPGAAMKLNGHAVTRLARICAEHGTRLLHISTDYVFAGDATTPYPEDAPTDPLNSYGRSKLAGEKAVLAHLPQDGYVVRTAWLYGEHGHNFVATMLRLAAQRETVDVVDDQFGQPTWSYALAQRLVELGLRAVDGSAPAGIYHGTAGGRTTWCGLARAVFTTVGLDPGRVRPTTSDRFPRAARRPSYSVLAHGRWREANLPAMAPWHAMLDQALSRPGFLALWSR
jgi:dTDP-4-dehydrorhamnose reductase